MSRLVHPFEIAALGKAPFRCVGTYIEVGPKVSIVKGVRLEVGAPGQPMGKCDYCGMGIKYVFAIKSADGSRFSVGSECVKKTCHKGSRVYTEVEKSINKIKRDLRHKKEAEKIEEVKRWVELPSVRDHLSSLPHPSKYRADNGDTRLDWALWMLSNSGNRGKCSVHSYVKKLIKSCSISL